MGGCCGDCGSDADAQSVKTQLTDNKQHDRNGAQTADDSGCCAGGCKCGDECIDELARALCADDDCHVHDQGATQSDNAAAIGIVPNPPKTVNNEDNMSTSGCSCCEEEPSESIAEDDKGKTNDVPPSASVKSGASGLRKRISAKAPTSPSPQPKEACGEHRSIARSRYDTLAAFGCVCKALLARGLRSCCAPPVGAKARAASRSSNRESARLVPRSRVSSESSRRASVDSCCGKSDCGKPAVSVRSLSYRGHAGTRSVKSAAKRKSCASVDSCCRDGSCDIEDKASVDSCCRDGPRVDKVSVESCCRDGCCTKEAVEVKSRASVDSCCRDGRCKDDDGASVDSCCRDSCCGVSASAEDKGGEDQKNVHVAIDMAGNTPVASGEHAILAIKGMTCTGCEQKLKRTLYGIEAISNVKTSLVLCRAEFDFDKGAAELTSLIQLIEQRSGFTAEVINAGSKRELLLTVDPSLHEKLLSIPFPTGVESIKRVGKDTVNVLYSPRIIGARKILEEYDTFSPVLAPEPQDPSLAAGAKHIRSLATRMTLSIILTIPVLVMTWAPLPPHPRAYPIVSLVLATIVQTVITGPFYVSSLRSLVFSRLVEVEMLIVLSTTTAYVYSVVAFAFDMLGRPLSTGEFFETSTLLVTLIMIGQVVSAVARQRAIEAISIRSLQERKARIVLPDGTEQDVDIRLLQYDDHFKVLPDSAIITDGVVLSGSSTVDESMMTGESLPVEKASGDTVIAGTHNGPSPLVVKVTRLPGENTISDIAGMVDHARFSRARVQETADWVCGWFVPVVLMLAIAVFAIQLGVSIGVRHQRGGDAVVTALTYAVSVLAISCPCAIGLAVPMVILIAGGVGAKLGLVFKAATTIEQARKVSHVVLDKTGTVTQGKLSVVERFMDETAEFEVGPVVAALVASSRHPVARAVAVNLESMAGAKVGCPTSVENVEVVVGKGVQASLRGRTLRGGSAAWLGLESHPAVEPLLARGLTTFCVVHGTGLVAAFGLSDVLRPEARSVLRALSARGIPVSILSGDQPAAVYSVAAELGIPAERVRAGCLPADKQAYVAALASQGETVLFCGDGTNDAVALAQAAIGVHMHIDDGAGVAAASAADVVLTHASLVGLVTLLELSDAVTLRIAANFAWSFVYNLVAILFAAGAFVNARIPPAYAGLGELVSVLPVVLVAVQLRWFKPSTA